MYADKTDTQTTTAAIKAGVSAYVVGEVNAERVRPIVEVAIARFGEFQALREELERTQNTLAERKVVERAKGLLMQRRKLDEQTAYATLRKLAMDRNQRLVDVARTLIELSDVLG
jgi:response regulator NasT